MICYALAMEKQHLGPHVFVGYRIKIFWSDLFITSPDHLDKFDIDSTCALTNNSNQAPSSLFAKHENKST